MMEKRQHARASIDVPVTFSLKDSTVFHDGVGRDLSLGGMRVETSVALAFNTAIVLRVTLRTSTGAMQTFTLPGVVRWVRAGAMGVQFGLLGAQETHAITELRRAAGK